MKPEPTRVVDWEEGQCGIDDQGIGWFRLNGSYALLSTDKGVFAIEIGWRFETYRHATLDESARQVFIDYFSGKGK